MAGREDALAVVAAYQELDDLFASDPWFFFCELVQTVDESIVAGMRSNRIQPWPREYQFLREVVAHLRSDPMVVIPKSRRMLISWLIAAFFVWYARYHGNSALFWISETEKKAAYIVDKRCLFIENNLRMKEFRQKVETTKTKDSLVGNVRYPNGSYIWALPEGGNVLRAYTASKVMVDESEFQNDAPETLRALIPMIENGAQAILVSSSNGPIGIIADICKEIGFRSWKDVPRLLAQAA